MATGTSRCPGTCSRPQQTSPDSPVGPEWGRQGTAVGPSALHLDPGTPPFPSVCSVIPPRPALGAPPPGTPLCCPHLHNPQGSPEPIIFSMWILEASISRVKLRPARPGSS